MENSPTSDNVDLICGTLNKQLLDAVKNGHKIAWNFTWTMDLTEWLSSGGTSEPSICHREFSVNWHKID